MRLHRHIIRQNDIEAAGGTAILGSEIYLSTKQDPRLASNIVDDRLGTAISFTNDRKRLQDNQRHIPWSF